MSLWLVQTKIYLSCHNLGQYCRLCNAQKGRYGLKKSLMKTSKVIFHILELFQPQFLPQIFTFQICLMKICNRVDRGNFSLLRVSVLKRKNHSKNMYFNFERQENWIASSSFYSDKLR